jgi:hypothetical protein
MRKRRLVLWLVTVSLVQCAVFAGPYQQLSATPAYKRAEVTFLDGSTLVLSQPRFVWHWVYFSEGQRYHNPTWYRKESLDFHYRRYVRGVTLDGVVMASDLATIEIIWPDGIEKKSSVGVFPEGITVKARSGSQLKISDLSYEAMPTSAFLQGLPQPEVRGDSEVRRWVLEGVTQLEGQQVRMEVELKSMQSHGKKEEAPQKITFLVD